MATLFFMLMKFFLTALCENLIAVRGRTLNEAALESKFLSVDFFLGRDRQSLPGMQVSLTPRNSDLRVRRFTDP
jgi:hypothetical protein